MYHDVPSYTVSEPSSLPCRKSIPFLHAVYIVGFLGPAALVLKNIWPGLSLVQAVTFKLARLNDGRLLPAHGLKPGHAHHYRNDTQ
jgi:hypothetical protein